MILSIDTRSAGGITRLRLAGEIDLSTAALLSQATTDALEPGPDSIIVDLADITFCDCTGFTWLITCRSAALAHGAAYQVVNPTGCPLRVMQLLNLHSLLTARAQGDPTPRSGSLPTLDRRMQTCTNGDR
jgi:anti-sigma B factor antagonist